MLKGPLYVIAFLLFISWFIGYIVFNIDGIFHFIFLAAVAVLLFSALSDTRKEQNIKN